MPSGIEPGSRRPLANTLTIMLIRIDNLLVRIPVPLSHGITNEPMNLYEEDILLTVAGNFWINLTNTFKWYFSNTLFFQFNILLCVYWTEK